MKLINKNIIGVKCAVIAILVVLCSGCTIAAGSYPYAERYKIHQSEERVIEAVATYKKLYPQYNVPPEIGLNDGRRDDSDLWHHVYFYFPDEDEIIKTWLRSDSDNTTTFAFVGVNKGLVLGNWKEVNKDLDERTNALEKNKFEKRILNAINTISTEHELSN